MLIPFKKSTLKAQSNNYQLLEREKEFKKTYKKIMKKSNNYTLHQIAIRNKQPKR